MPSPIGREFAQVTFGERLHVVGTALRLPVILAWSLLTKPFVARNAAKPWRRVLVDEAYLNLLWAFNRVQLQYMFGGSSLKIIETWSKQTKTQLEVEEIGEDAKLIWIGPKRTEKVILYLHGGAFLIPLQDSSLSFWKYTQAELKGRGQDVGIVVLQYTLVPNGRFPTQLQQTVRALEHLQAAGVQPQNLQITGDSAGGNLALQLISHILHPVDNVPRVQLSAPIRGAYLMSPWVRLGSPKAGKQYDGIDILNYRIGSEWGQDVLLGIPESQNVYLEAANASSTWFAGVEKVVSRVLTTAGGVEMLKDDIVQFNDIFAKHHKEVEFIIQEDGIHDDPFNDFALGGPVGDVTPLIVDWFFTGFNQ